MTITETTPLTVPMAVTDAFPLAVDMAAALPAGGSVSAPTATLVSLATNASIALGTLSVSGTEVIVPLVGSALAHGTTYELTVVYTAASGVTLTTTTLIEVT